MARLIRRFGCLALLILLGAGAFLVGRDHVRRHPQDVPWTALELAHPPGRFTASKLAAMGSNPAHCRALLAKVPTLDRAAPPRRGGEQCGYADGVVLGEGRDARFGGALVTSCPVAAALYLWERDSLQRAALRHFATTVTAVDHAGSYSCRRIYGRSDGPFSEHATADAVDIVGFRLADGTRISVVRDWDEEGPKADFLREGPRRRVQAVRDHLVARLQCRPRRSSAPRHGGPRPDGLANVPLTAPSRRLRA